ncbi:MAG: DUF5675 family protein [Prevotellaceae bacterium]|nr:DUF5675 family protein [Prevotellaceae bacterium]
MKKIVKVALLAGSLLTGVQTLPAAGQGKVNKKANATLDSINAVWLTNVPMKKNELGKLYEEQQSFTNTTGCAVKITSITTPEPTGFTQTIVELWQSFWSLFDEPDNVVGIELSWLRTAEGWSIDKIEVKPTLVTGIFPSEAIDAFRDAIEKHREEKPLTLKREVTVHKKIAEELKKLKEKLSIGINIEITRLSNNASRTVGTINVDNGAITGYTLELPKGTSAEAQSTCTNEKKDNNECKRILAGTYEFEINTNPNSDKINKSLSLSNPPGRSAILIHSGVNARIWSMGCILAVRNNPTGDADNAIAAQRANQQIADSESFCIEIVNYVKQKKAEIQTKYKVTKVKMTVRISDND